MNTPSTPQRPIGTGYGATTTARDIMKGVDLSGKTAVVTGGYSGLGRETVRVLRGAGARVIVPARDVSRARAALTGIDGVRIEEMDLLDPASIDAFAARVLASADALHILVNSAGIMACPLTRDARGHESQLATNHLGHFQLTLRLLPALRRARGARVVSVSSYGHRFSPLVFDDPDFERRPYDRWAAYGQSKTANILFALALDMREQGSGVRAFSLHPGSIVGTGLEKHLDREELRRLGVIDADGRPIIDHARNMKTVEQGAATSVFCAVSPKLDGLGGVYCENCDIAPLAMQTSSSVDDLQARASDPARRSGVMSYAVDPHAADRLFSLSEQLLRR